MKRSQRKKRLFLIVLSSVFMFYSCQKEEIINSEEVVVALETSEVQKSKNFVGLAEVKSLATVLEYPVINDIEISHVKSSEVPSTFKDIEAVLEVPDENGDPSFYIVNYQDGGYIMISADNRLEPIRAFSYNEKFPFNSDDMPSGLIHWLSQTTDMVHDVRILDEEQTVSVAQAWNICELQATLAVTRIAECEDPNPSCQNSSETVGPLMTTEWGQGGLYNDLVQFENCTTGTAPTGCVATAMAQVMRFHESPANYNWDAMPDNSGSNATAILMRDIGNAVSMEYTCTTSGANMNNAAVALMANFGYQSVSYTGFDRDDVIQQIRWRRPVILSGYRTKDEDCFLWWCSSSYSNGHAWVSDGFRKYKRCNYDDYGNLYSTSTYYYLHMNWGWDGSENGFYNWNDWSPGTRDYQYKKEMIINIRP
ncbi:C10 family peptidase [Aquimarina pacifica]|uniref:C10 family peptidase n=1 Tax=Aquimarina pacifica TaxID=1296415 RepID=UPI00046F5ED2|nr:C10 family peptidase [Aquimarina pacifica]